MAGHHRHGARYDREGEREREEREYREERDGGYREREEREYREERDGGYREDWEGREGRAQAGPSSLPRPGYHEPASGFPQQRQAIAAPATMQVMGEWNKSNLGKV
jgi:hypothetical protein